MSSRVKTLIAGATIALLTVPACSSPQPASTATTPSQTSSATPTPSPAPQAAPTTIPADRSGNAPVILHKQIGEKASLGCPDNTTAPCDVDFAITAIRPEVQCDLGGTQIKPDEQLLRFDIEIWTAQQFDSTEASTALFLNNWGIGDAQGVDNDLESYTGVRCAGELVGDQISKLLLPGSHMRKSVYVTAPKGATVLRLYYGERGDGWTWDIPPAG